ncbi:predicted flavin-nucleotide-binding protein [Longilinea arvoryzae]|uniref:Predicted flavin-nucleotide-binding protein n=1 Tax=Longilinea arvoryzae TaxID=360412 RepID=A0A0S7BEI0_9CHLR|nr:pyridoxamine 5'-phosphate oxidase family protein [Longilinea arvoryzae]GAP12440.1 predicted flavin-nucleotide-binding protein [Longilinea arvoryzae]
MQNIPPERKAQIDAVLAQAVTAKLATANPKTTQPHVVPVWFWWDGERIWISAFSSTRKVKELRLNQRCSILVEPLPGTSPLQGVLLEGVAELISADRERVAQFSERIYARYLTAEELQAEAPQSWMVDPENTLVSLNPDKLMAF